MNQLVDATSQLAAATKRASGDYGRHQATDCSAATETEQVATATNERVSTIRMWHAVLERQTRWHDRPMSRPRRRPGRLAGLQATNDLTDGSAAPESDPLPESETQNIGAVSRCDPRNRRTLIWTLNAASQRGCACG